MVTTELLGNIRGNPGQTGPQGLRGLPGAADVPTDPAMAEIMAASDSETFAASEVSMQVFDRRAYYGYELNPRWSTAVDRVRAGTGSAKVLCIGDSTTAGIGSAGTFAAEQSWPSRLAIHLNRTLAKTSWGLAIPPSSTSSTTDSRWTLGTGWKHTTLAGIGLGGKNTAYQGSPGVSTLTFLDPRIGVNRYDIYYVTNTSSSGTFTARVGTGTPVVVNTIAGTAGLAKVTVTGPSLSSTTPLTITNTGVSGEVWIVGVDPYGDGESRITVGNAGASGSSTATWLQQNSGSDKWNVFSFLPLYQPDLTIIDLGINDSPDVSVADYISRINTLVTAARNAGSAVLMKTMIPSQPADKRAREGEYSSALRSQLSSPRPAVLDLLNHYGTWERNNVRGWMNDTLHGNAGIYEDEGAVVAAFLFRCYNHGA